MTNWLQMAKTKRTEESTLHLMFQKQERNKGIALH